MRIVQYVPSTRRRSSGALRRYGRVCATAFGARYSINCFLRASWKHSTVCALAPFQQAAAYAASGEHRTMSRSTAAGDVSVKLQSTEYLSCLRTVYPSAAWPAAVTGLSTVRTVAPPEDACAVPARASVPTAIAAV